MKIQFSLKKLSCRCHLFGFSFNFICTGSPLLMWFLAKALGNSRQGLLGFNGFLMGFDGKTILESVKCIGSVFTFQLIYIHANKEIDATKLLY